MLDFELYQPTYYAFGRGRQAMAGSLVKRFGGTRVLLHYGGGSAVRSGLLDQVKASLREAGIHFAELGGVQPNPRSGLIYEGIALCRKEGLDFVLSVGGGSAIDSGKAIAVGVPYAGDFWDFYAGKAAPQTALKHGCIITLAATGSEGSNSAVITHENGMLKRGINTDLNRPAFSILNPELTFSVNKYHTACGVVDIMSHVLERYFTAVLDVDLTDRLCEAVLQSVIKAGPAAIAEPDSYEARASLLWAGTLAHNNTVGAGRLADFASHAIEHELSALYDVAHGAGLAVVFPAWMAYVMEGNITRFAQYAVRVWNCGMDFENPRNTALEGIARTRAFFRSIGMPLTFAEIGAREEDIPLLAGKCKADAQGLLGNFQRLTKEDVAGIYRLCLQ